MDDEEEFTPCRECPRPDDCHMMSECQGFDPEDEHDVG
jgi:hypothetical protein